MQPSARRSNRWPWLLRVREDGASASECRQHIHLRDDGDAGGGRGPLRGQLRVRRVHGRLRGHVCAAVGAGLEEDQAQPGDKRAQPSSGGPFVQRLEAVCELPAISVMSASDASHDAWLSQLLRDAAMARFRDEDRAAATTLARGEGVTAWVSGYGNKGGTDGDSGTAHRDRDTHGALLGVDRLFADGGRAGPLRVALSHSMFIEGKTVESNARGLARPRSDPSGERDEGQHHCRVGHHGRMRYASTPGKGAGQERRGVGARARITGGRRRTRGRGGRSAAATAAATTASPATGWRSGASRTRGSTR